MEGTTELVVVKQEGKTVSANVLDNHHKESVETSSKSKQEEEISSKVKQNIIPRLENPAQTYKIEEEDKSTNEIKIETDLRTHCDFPPELISSRLDEMFLTNDEGNNSNSKYEDPQNIFKKHHNLAYDSNFTFACKQCNYITKQNWNLSRHMKMIHQENTEHFECPKQCNYKTKLQYNLMRHIKSTHKKDSTNFNCPFCFYSTKTKRDMKTHLKEHDDSTDDETEEDSSAEVNITSDDVNLHKPDFVTTGDLKTGSDIKHNGQEIKQEVISDDDNCDLYEYNNQLEQEDDCKKIFVKKEEPDYKEDIEIYIKEHRIDLDFSNGTSTSETQGNESILVVDSEDDESSVTCTTENTPKPAQGVQNHMNIQFVAISDDNFARYNCTYCAFTTGSKPYLSAHVKNEHEEYSIYKQCKYCTYKAKTQCGLNRHFKLKHDTNTEIYKCASCPFETKYKPEFNRHYKLKHDENSVSFACVYCKYVTKRKASLTRHIRIRHNDQTEKLKCSHCDYTTKWKQSLNTHVKKVHKDSDSVFQCTMCDYKSIFRHIYVLHLKNAHQQKQ